MMCLICRLHLVRMPINFYLNMQKRGWNYKEALTCYAARNNFEFDKRHINSSDIVIMVMPCGKSGHLELIYSIRAGKESHILFDKEPERFDLMYNFVTVENINFSIDSLKNRLNIT